MRVEIIIEYYEERLEWQNHKSYSSWLCHWSGSLFALAGRGCGEPTREIKRGSTILRPIALWFGGVFSCPSINTNLAKIVYK